MKKLNFKEFSVYIGVSRKNKQVVDVREGFADLIYTNMNGIKAHALAVKIFESSGETEFSDSEADIIRRVAETLSLPGFIDGLDEQMKKGAEDESNLQQADTV